MDVVRSIESLRGRVADWRAHGDPVALVPTMGALHEGHMALVRTARERARRVVVTIFVNPTQFAPGDDFASYPRQERADRDILGAAGADLLFMPSVAEMYPDGHSTRVRVGGPADTLETEFRPGHFDGVATVVAKLLLQALPDLAFFGEKDYQQLLVIRRMATDLGLPVDVIGYPTIREADGLALSSRNAYLSPEERAKAPALHKALVRAGSAIKAGAPVSRVLSAAGLDLKTAGFRVDYVELRNAETLAPVADLKTEKLRLLAAAWLGKTRLIDNIGV
jgi:pantoate--beta-alanine ligase